MSGIFPNALHVARREYLFRVRGRAFRVTTLLLAVAVLAITQVPTIVGALGVADAPELAVVNRADGIAPDPVTTLQAALIVGSDPQAALNGEQPEVDPDAPRPRVRGTEDEDGARAEVRDGDLDGLLIISRGEDEELGFEYVSSSGPTNQTRIIVQSAATSIAIADRLGRAGISTGEQSALFSAVDFEVTAADPDDARSDEDFGGAFILAYALVILTFMAILTYGNWVAQSVAEEKSGRVMELLITAATPRQLLTGKVLGTGAAGLTQYVVIVGALVVGLVAGGPASEALGASGSLPFELPDVGVLTLLAFFVFFLLGFVLYATLYAAAGSMVTRIEDVQQAAGPLLFLAMAGYFAAFTGLNDPDARWVQVLSLVPFFSPYLMPARMLLTSPTPAEIGIAIGLLVVTLLGAIWLASRIYSAGVLMYGQRVGLRTILRATRVAR